MTCATPRRTTVGDPVEGYLTSTCILTRDAAGALHRAQQRFTERGYTLKVYDCYRPQRVVSEFVSWATDLADQRMKAEFCPRLEKSVLFASSLWPCLPSADTDPHYRAGPNTHGYVSRGHNYFDFRLP